MREKDPRRNAFVWSGVLFLFPVVFLAGVGIWALRDQRDSVTERARQEAAQLCARVAADFERGLGKRIDEWESAAIPRRDIVALANGEVRGFFYERAPRPAPESEAARRWREAAENEGDPAEVAAAFPDGLTDAGLPIAPLAYYHVAAKGKDPSDIERFLKSAVLEHPSAITAHLVDAMAKRAPQFSVAEWRARWDKDERTRRMLATHAARLVESWESQWLVHDDAAYRAETQGETVRCVGKDAVERAFLAAVAEETVPDYLALNAIHDGMSLRSADPAFDFASAHYGQTRVAALLMSPRDLYRGYRRQVAWLAALIGVAALGALAAFLATRRALVRQRQLNRQQSNFVSSVSHELRAPVAAIRLMSERLKGGRVEDEEKEAEYYDFIERESQRLTGLISNVLDFSRVERGQKRYAFAETDIRKLVRETAKLMEPLADGRAIDLEIEDLSRDPVIDGMAVQQALVNLLDNAIKYSPSKAPITVRLRETDKAVLLAVQDRGPGVPADERAKIFDRFYRAGSELRRETEGVGIGLSIVKHIAEAHGGSVALHSAPDEGSTFTLKIPIRQ